ncbi:MAG: Flp/Fap pilin component [Cryptosporangiaceae bacterium]|jgi:pilus assembly protein Flp/PilA|nr:Flp/Fap pilin component [Cryptosporangiaceae bacterium]
MYYLTAKIAAKFAVMRSERERGATAVEYGLMVALIAAVIVTVVAALGTTITGKFQTVLDAISK